MLRDSLPTYQLPKPNDLSVPNNHEVEQILLFVDNYVSEFPAYYKAIKDSDRENRISDFLVHHFQLCKTENNQDYFPYDFRKNPTQASSGKETDIGVFVLTRGRKPSPLIEFEAKRFSESSNNEQYVYGVRGGIERFKRGFHSSHLSVGGMFAYIQSNDSPFWLKKVNEWIMNEASKVNKETGGFKWSSSEILGPPSLIITPGEPSLNKYQSQHSRVNPYGELRIFHYFINLT